jgi:hypothetical protein
MNADPLRKLLTRADQDIPAPSIVNVAAAVVRRAQRRARMRGTAAMLTLLVAVGSICFHGLSFRRDVKLKAGTMQGDGVLIREAELLSYDDVAVHLKTAHALQTLENNSKRRRQRIEQARQIDPIERLYELREEAGVILLRTADRQSARNNKESEAICREVLRFLPDTPAAQQARRRLGNSGI